MQREPALEAMAAGQAASWRASWVGQSSPDAWPPADDVLEHDVAWLHAQCERPDQQVLVVGDGAGRAVPFFVHDGQIDFDFGEWTLASARARRHVLVGNFRDMPAPEWAPVFDAARKALASRGVVFLLGVVAGEGLHEALSLPSVARRFLVVPHGPTYERRLCRLGDSLEAYLQELASGRRQDLRRSRRRFEREFEGRHELAVLTDEHALGAMLDAVEPVSRRTYQARLRGLALSRHGHSGREVLEGARRGIARCYLLSVDGRPVAWRIGFLYRGVYYSHHIGYDPDFEHWHPGVVMHLAVIEDLSQRSVGARYLDMLYGDNDFKRKAANVSRTEANYYLFPRTARGWWTWARLATCNRLSASAGEFLERHGLKARLRRWIRRR